jgi:hypothetical protein
MFTGALTVRGGTSHPPCCIASNTCFWQPGNPKHKCLALPNNYVSMHICSRNPGRLNLPNVTPSKSTLFCATPHAQLQSLLCHVNYMGSSQSSRKRHPSTVLKANRHVASFMVHNARGSAIFREALSPLPIPPFHCSNGGP